MLFVLLIVLALLDSPVLLGGVGLLKAPRYAILGAIGLLAMFGVTHAFGLLAVLRDYFEIVAKLLHG